jgi:hypothetical protein
VYVKPTTARALFDASGRLRALVADGEDTPEPLAFLDVPEGSEPLTREQITAALAELSDDELAAVIDAAVAEGQSIGASDDPITPEVLARINALADAREAAEAQIAANETAVQEAQAARDEALARLTRPEGADDSTDGDEGAGDGSEGAEEHEGAGTGTPEPVTAGAPRRTRPNALPRPGQRTGGASATPRGNGDGGYVAPAARVALVAAAGLDAAGLANGTTIDSAQQIADAFNQRRHSLRGTSGGDGEQIPVVQIQTTYPAERYLSGTDPDGNTRNLVAATSAATLTASAQAARSRDALRADLLLGAGMGSGDDDIDAAFALADARINGWFATRNVNVTWHLDGRPATLAAAGEVGMANQFYAAWADNAAVPDFPAQVEALMWVEGEMVALDGGTLDLGVVRDSTLNQNNRYKQFSETWEGVAHRGVESIRLVQDLQVTGMTAGTADTAAILAA